MAIIDIDSSGKLGDKRGFAHLNYIQPFHYCVSQVVRTERKTIYIIGSLRNPLIPAFANEIQALGFEAFADWYAAGPEADDKWRDYAKERGLTYGEALASYAATHVFNFDKQHIDRSDAVVMLMPAGKSGHLELGYAIGSGKRGYILFDQEPERYDVMAQFATKVFFNKSDLFQELQRAIK
jgi:hypothetical protein